MPTVESPLIQPGPSVIDDQTAFSTFRVIVRFNLGPFMAQIGLYFAAARAPW